MNPRLFPALVFCALTLQAQVKLTPQPHQISIDIDGQPFSTLILESEVPKPYLYPLRSASGKLVTRQFPMAHVEGESYDHPHHRGIWFGHIDVHGSDFWSNDPLNHAKNYGKVTVKQAPTVKDGAQSGSIHVLLDWWGHDGKQLLTEDRTMTFYSDTVLRTIDFDATLTAATRLVFGDDKDGTFALRLADALNEQHTGKMTNAEGKQGMKNVWGKRSNWVDYVGQIEGETLGVAMFDHPENPGHPNYWHARDYGLFAINLFGQNAFDSALPKKETVLEAGQNLRYRFRVVIHPGDTEHAKIADLYRQYAAK